MPNTIRPNASSTLKISGRSVMLYRSEYDRAAKATRQRYLGGFSRGLTAIPSKFLRLLESQTQDPDKRQAMLARIEIEALEPARQRASEAEKRRENLKAIAPVIEARRAVTRAARCVESAADCAELSAELRELQQAYDQVLLARPIRDVSDDGALHVFEALGTACDEVVDVLQRLPRRATPTREAVNAWQRTWYQYQDMLSAVTRRSAFKRPAGWSDKGVRTMVESGVDANSV
jgi:plasmid stabilization system protein ParE